MQVLLLFDQNQSEQPALDYHLSCPLIFCRQYSHLLFLADAKGESYLCELSLEKGVLSRVTRGANLINDVGFTADGEKAAVALRSIGLSSIRGSSTRGGISASRQALETVFFFLV